ncbi:wall-associated receptor kinase-like 22 [Neltuma alba]|uniref:wall-associated receptor kinase-like 22 n=1 Tax=Neltuma alba TaxID=207710 RepID=UPI0010A53F3C|nr:wall-associated receptor kinase-like 22 [Prosopis alba]
MKLPSFHILLLLFVLSQSLHCCCQPDPVTDAQCTFNETTKLGYKCNGFQNSCTSYVAYRSNPRYNTALTIANLLDSHASSIASLNNLSSNTKHIPSNQIVVVPIDCSCLGGIYQHPVSYAVQKGDTYYELTVFSYQNLSICQMIVRQNYGFDALNLTIGDEISVPVLCACPTTDQIADGVYSLLVLPVNPGDSLESIAEDYGTNPQTLMTANQLHSNTTINISTTLLVPRKPSSCKLNPHLFYCTCSFSEEYDPDSSSNTLNCDHIQPDPDPDRFPVKLVASLGVGVGVGLLSLFLLGRKLYQCLKQKQERARKEKLFKQNGGLLLQEKMSCYENGDKARLFTAEELERATDNYNRSRFLGQGGFGTVYKGMLPEGTIVAVKKAKEIVRSQIETFINEVVILSQINHRNVVKLLGWCLETEAPLLVYEFIANGTLSHHIHNQELEGKLSWDIRLRIACEVSGAVAYMHSAASIPVFHRDIKTSNILLDHKYSAKVSDFGTSRSVPNDRTHLTTMVQGTFGYLDPEYFQSSQFTDKSDVYSFGVVLIELITGRKPITFSEEDQGQNLVSEFIALMKKDQVFEILDARVVHEARKDDILSIVNLAKRCVKLNGKKRPTMREVSAELEGLRKTQNTLQITHCSLKFPLDRKSAMHPTLDSDQESTEESMSLMFQIDSTPI